MKQEILIVYIATGRYIGFFDKFKESLKYFCPNSIKRVFLVSDYPCDSDLLIEDKPWPLTALLKFHYMKRAIDNAQKDVFDYVFYFNANVEFKRVIDESVILKDKLVAVPHHAWDKENHDPLKFTFGTRLDPKCKAYIDSDEYLYHNSGVFGGPTKLLYEACNVINEWTYYDLAHNRIPMWHDESYWNKFIFDNPDKVITLSQDFSVDEGDEWEYAHTNPYLVYCDKGKIQEDKMRYF